MLYRIFTEDKNKKQLEKTISKHFEGFTLYKTTGFWRLQKEKSLVIEIIDDIPIDRINNLAKDIKRINKQGAVLVQKLQNNNWFV